jgi:hypothetical protein
VTVGFFDYRGECSKGYIDVVWRRGREEEEEEEENRGEKGNW